MESRLLHSLACEGTELQEQPRDDVHFRSLNQPHLQPESVPGKGLSLLPETPAGGGRSWDSDCFPQAAPFYSCQSFTLPLDGFIFGIKADLRDGERVGLCGLGAGG